MKLRCRNKNRHDYKYYGGRGIDICDEWANSFELFFRDVGEISEDVEIDRIDNTLGYFKGNVRLATKRENIQNRSTSKWWVIDRYRYPSAASAAKMLGVTYQTIIRWCEGNHHGKYYYPPKSNCFSELKYPKI
jgi:hypothetical protein